MRVGCPREIKNHEYRVGLTPGSVREYVAHGHEVLVETGAGAGIGADDNAYRAAGAKIAATAHLLRSPKNAERLLAALRSALARKGKAQTVAELRKEFGLT